MSKYEYADTDSIKVSLNNTYGENATSKDNNKTGIEILHDMFNTAIGKQLLNKSYGSALQRMFESENKKITASIMFLSTQLGVWTGTVYEYNELVKQLSETNLHLVILKKE